ncbi:MAG: RecX family transcriptional regulator [Muribaculaceae bacterium]|nr:RecX family transcriptional regulator [Muribaculaceae bacterium]
MPSGKPVDPEKIRQRMASLCARSEQCESDIRTKIRRAGIFPDKEQEIIDFLMEHRFLDNARFARAFASDKVRFSGWGRIKIRNALLMKRIPSDLIDEAIGGVEESDYEAAILSAARAKSRGLDLSQRDDAMKLCRHLASRGFEPSLCISMMKRMRLEQKQQQESLTEEE